jgi:hypothetical protein
VDQLNPAAAAGREDAFDVHQAVQNAILYGILPLWLIPGFLDYLFHRKSSIQTTSGTHESLIHALQMTTVGVPTLMALLLDVNATVIGTTIVATAAHEALTLWDIAYAEPRRRPEPNEQHVHSFLEVLPVMALTSLMTLHPAQTAALFGRGKAAAEWTLRLKRPPLGRRYIGIIAAAVAALMILPYGEEFMRCYRADRTFAPHPLPDDGGAGPGVSDGRTG